MFFNLLRSSDNTTAGKDEGICLRQAVNNSGCFELFKYYNKDVEAAWYPANFLSKGKSRHNMKGCIGLKRLFKTLESNTNLDNMNVVIMVKDTVRVQEDPLEYDKVKQQLERICQRTKILSIKILPTDEYHLDDQEGATEKFIRNSALKEAVAVVGSQKGVASMLKDERSEKEKKVQQKVNKRAAALEKMVKKENSGAKDLVNNICDRLLTDDAEFGQVYQLLLEQFGEELNGGENRLVHATNHDVVTERVRQIISSYKTKLEELKDDVSLPKWLQDISGMNYLRNSKHVNADGVLR